MPSIPKTFLFYYQIQSLPNLFSLKTIVERSATPAKSAARDRYGEGITVVNNLEDVLNDPEVQCVVVGTPNTTHYPFAKVSSYVVVIHMQSHLSTTRRPY